MSLHVHVPADTEALRRRLSRWLGASAVAIFAILVLPGLASGTGLARSSDAPAFDLPLLGGGRVTSAELLGRAVVINVWASWCAPCRQEAPVLSRVYLEYAGKPVEFVGVNIWDRNQDALDFLKAFETTYPNGVDEAGIIAIDYGVRGIPEKFFIDQQGVVRQKFVGPMQADALRAAIDGLLSAGPAPAKDATIDPY